MLCTICSRTLEGVCDPSRTVRVCRIEEFIKEGSIPGFDLPGDRPDDPEHHHPEYYMFGHHASSESYERSIRDGCFLCCLLNSQCRPYRNRESQAIDKLQYFSLLAINFQLPGGFILALFSSAGYIQRPMLELNGSVADFKLDICPSTRDNVTMGLVKNWLGTCLESHTRCNQSKGSGFIPDYLLQMDAVTQCFRLVAAADIQPGTRYCTFTYPYQEEEGLFVNVQLQQPLSTLPQTYQDAFFVVKTLGLEHLWIDHFCLSEDTQLSAQKLSEKRTDVFSNSFCGICATSALSSSSGLFASRELDSITAGIVDFPLDSNGNTALLEFNQKPLKIHSLVDEPILQSARAMEERLLTPRMVHFTSTQVYWECYGALSSEVNPQGVILRPDAHLCIEGDKTKGGRPLLSLWKPLFETWFWSREDARDELLGRWHKLMAFYARGYSNLPGQRLLGLNCAVMEMKHALRELGRDDTYLAGMWKDTLPVGLLWSVLNTGTRPTECYAPSWSWASINGLLTFPDDSAQDFDKGTLCKFISGAFEENDTARITTGHIILKGKLTLAKIALDTIWPPMDWIKRDILSIADPNTGSYLAEVPDSAHRYHWNITFDTEEDARESVFFMPIKRAEHKKMDGDSEHLSLIKGLALYKLDNGSFRRCGLGEIVIGESQDVLKGLPDYEIRVV